MNNIFQYKGYSGTVEYSFDDNIFLGKVIGVRELKPQTPMVHTV